MASTLSRKGFSLIEMMVAMAIFSLVILVIFGVVSSAQKTMKFEMDKDTVTGGAVQLIGRMGRDIRESSYAYVFAGDWLATSGGGSVSIVVARNYFSTNPLLGGNTLVPGISNEGWAQCPNPVCGWCNRPDGSNTVPVEPRAFLARPVRNNGQIGSASFTPTNFQQNDVDARGRLYNHLDPGENCPTCGQALVAESFISGLMFFSPRKVDKSFSYGGATGREVCWESMVFYCPFRMGKGQSEMRRYIFYASSINSAASLIDFMDFDGNGIIESPPMTDVSGAFLLDADGESFCLLNSGGTADKLLYTRWGSGRTFRIEIDRDTGMADVTTTGPYGAGSTSMRCKMTRFAAGLTDFDASTFLNNPSWMSGGVPQNPMGVAELGVVRVTLQCDKEARPWFGNLESVQSTMFRPRN